MVKYYHSSQCQLSNWEGKHLSTQNNMYHQFAKLFSINLEANGKTYRKSLQTLRNKYVVHLFVTSSSDLMFKKVLILITYLNKMSVTNSKRLSRSEYERIHAEKF